MNGEVWHSLQRNVKGMQWVVGVGWGGYLGLGLAKHGEKAYTWRIQHDNCNRSGGCEQADAVSEA